MFIGHFAVAFAAKKAAPKTSLGTLFLSAQLVDLLWPLFLLLGLEHVRISPGITVVTPLDFYDYPFTHSLLASAFWSALLGVIYFRIRKDKRGALAVGLVVFSHWVLDFLTHRPDLPLAPEVDVFLGLGLWNSVAATITVEACLFTIGVVLYLRATTARDRIGKYALWTLVGLLALIYIGNLIGPPPPDESTIAFVGNAGWLFVLWAYWIDQHRAPEPSSTGQA